MREYKEGILFENVNELVERWEQMDELFYLKINWKGQFANEAFPEIMVYNYRDEYKEILRNTLDYISLNFEKIYVNMLDSFLPALIEWEFKNKETGELVLTRDDMDKAKAPDEFISSIQINCEDNKNGRAYYSIVFSIDISKYNYDEGMETIFYDDRVIYWTEANSRQAILEFRDYDDEITYFGEE